MTSGVYIEDFNGLHYYNIHNNITKLITVNHFNNETC